ncbi:MAG: CHASE domain-containing protein [Ketobacteraceae bacterium]|nr:CHASE domain-containing protein [Ketobacteraceae bacterium]
MVTYSISLRVNEARNVELENYRADKVVRTIEERLRVYEQMLWSGVALIDAADSVSGEVWRKFVSTLDLETHWPGIQGLGFSVPVPADRVADFETKLHQEGFTDFRVHPNDSADYVTAIRYLEPFDWRNQRAHGYDMWSNPVRREAMRLARDQGVAAVSGKITLVQETQNDVQPGFLMYVPVYGSESPPATTTERQKNFAGWVYSPFRSYDFFEGLLSNDQTSMKFAVFDQDRLLPQNLMFVTGVNPEGFDDFIDGLKDSNDILLRQVNAQNRVWTVVFYDIGSATETMHDKLPRVAFWFIFLLDLLLFYVILSLHILVRNTDRRVAQRVQILEQEKNHLMLSAQSLQEEKASLESQLALLEEDRDDREHRVIELKKTVNDLSLRLGEEPPYKAGVTDE